MSHGPGVNLSFYTFCYIYNKTNMPKVIINCCNCGNEATKTHRQVNAYTTHFCGKSCAATYKNKHKKHGTKRSKLELWIEEQLALLYPSIEFHFNRKDAINSELDIYIPALNVAFELNGIFHYEPIFGALKLDKTKLNDISKTKACIDKQIDLCIIDISSQKYFKPETSKKYLDIITNIINERK
jgi:hypothetical protein